MNGSEQKLSSNLFLDKTSGRKLLHVYGIRGGGCSVFGCGSSDGSDSGGGGLCAGVCDGAAGVGVWAKTGDGGKG